MVSIPLVVLLLATYAYSIPVVINDNISKQNVELTTSKPMVMHLMDDGQSVNLPISGQLKLTTDRNGVQLTTSRPLLNNERLPREMFELVHPVAAHVRGIQVSSTVLPATVESSSQSLLLPRGIVQPSTVLPTTVESSSQSILLPRGIIESSTLFPTTVETSTVFNQRGIRGQNIQSKGVSQTTEVPSSSSVSSFAQTTGLLRNQRGEGAEEQHESTSMTMDEVTTEVSSTGRSNTVIEVIPGRNTKTEIIPGHNTETEIISGPNTKTEIIKGGSNRLVVEKKPLSQGQN